ncbi:hypothetical protein NA57DRAFT_51881 [Rhizodiscina lignyota]|uniref:Uncharacterized protein n=1 Tax=Rhizodiscina lignyota TaxID=1504668 RepID=A0A9P4MF49_9PEZI|nr:hypothetical protein NA57DRAFT_51881 [Rhizodiscina lignyota]
MKLNVKILTYFVIRLGAVVAASESESSSVDSLAEAPPAPHTEAHNEHSLDPEDLLDSLHVSWEEWAEHELPKYTRLQRATSQRRQYASRKSLTETLKNFKEFASVAYSAARPPG